MIRKPKQMSESMILGVVLTLAGGFQDAYSYNCRGQVFANAQSMLSGGEAMVLIIRVTPGGFKFYYYSPLRDCCYTANKITDNTKDSF